MTLREVQRRSRYILTLQQEFSKSIYAERLQAFEDAIYDLAVRNMELLNAGTITFIYKGKLYAPQGYADKHPNGKIHPDMREEIAAVIDFQDFQVLVEENKVKTYIANVLATARCFEDMGVLIPARVASPLRWVNHDILDVGEPMNPSEIETFKEANKENYGAFKRMFLRNLLLAS